MISNFALARRNSGSLFSHFAMAIALAGGAVVASAAIAPSAYAQDYSRGFVGVYEPVAALVGGDMPNWEAARAQFDSVAAAIETADDSNAAGNLALQIGNALNNPILQRRGLELMLASGKVVPEQVGQFQFFVGNLAFNAEDWAAARTALQAALDGGYTDNDPQGLLVETYLQEGSIAQGAAYVLSQASTLEASGQTVPEQWLLRVLAETYDANLVAESIAISRLLVSNHPTQKNWVNALQVVGALQQMEPQVELDLLRLMRETGAMTRRAEFVRYIEHADPRIMANEVLPVLAEGLAADIFTASDDYYAEVKSIADARAPADRRDLEEAVSEGETGDAGDAMSTGDMLYSVGDFARAEVLYQRALDQGGDTGKALTRIGIAQAKQAKFADAIATFDKITGDREIIAEMWAAYAATQMGG